jgi:hypothetical protein
MNRSFRASTALAAVAFVGVCGRPAQAQLTYSNQTNFYAIGFSDLTFGDATVAHEVDYQVDGANGATATPTVNIYGDVNSFHWNAFPGAGISGVSASIFTQTATATLTSNGMTGNAEYDYVSHNSDGIIFVGVNPVTSMTQMLFDSTNPDSTTPTTASEIDIILPGDWSTFGAGVHDILAGSFSISPDYTVTNNFGYDPTFGDTFFQAVYNGNGSAAPNVSFILNGVPEPSNVAMLAGLALSGLGFAVRLRRRR